MPWLTSWPPSLVCRVALARRCCLVEDFSRAYETAKKQRSLLDFSDLEHLAVRLLVDEAGGPTPLARQWGARYTEIMVDEYQDTNIKRAGSLDGQAIRDALLATKDFEGAAGVYNFASNGEMIKDLMVVQIVDGKHTIVPMD